MSAAASRARGASRCSRVARPTTLLIISRCVYRLEQRLDILGDVLRRSARLFDKDHLRAAFDALDDSLERPKPTADD